MADLRWGMEFQNNSYYQRNFEHQVFDEISLPPMQQTSSIPEVLPYSPYSYVPSFGLSPPPRPLDKPPWQLRHNHPPNFQSHPSYLSPSHTHFPSQIPQPNQLYNPYPQYSFTSNPQTLPFTHHMGPHTQTYEPQIQNSYPSPQNDPNLHLDYHYTDNQQSFAPPLEPQIATYPTPDYSSPAQITLNMLASTKTKQSTHPPNQFTYVCTQHNLEDHYNVEYARHVKEQNNEMSEIVKEQNNEIVEIFEEQNNDIAEIFEEQRKDLNAILKDHGEKMEAIIRRIYENLQKEENDACEEEETTDPLEALDNASMESNSLITYVESPNRFSATKMMNVGCGEENVNLIVSKRGLAMPTEVGIISDSSKAFKSQKSAKSLYLLYGLRQPFILPFEEKLGHVNNGKEKIMVECQSLAPLYNNQKYDTAHAICLFLENITKTENLVPLAILEKSGMPFRELSILGCQKVAKENREPLPEDLFWLLLTGKVPTNEQVEALSSELRSRATVPDHVYKTITVLPVTAHLMTQSATGVLALKVQCEFQKAYEKRIYKSKYWEPTFKDTLSLIAKVPIAAAYVNRKGMLRTRIETSKRDDIFLARNFKIQGHQTLIPSNIEVSVSNTCGKKVSNLMETKSIWVTQVILPKVGKEFSKRNFDPGGNLLVLNSVA